MMGQFAARASGAIARRERRSALLARQIEHDLWQRHWPVGTIFASQQELSERYRVGEDCLRDAVRILEFNGVGRMRPGPGGGLLVGRPSINLPVASIVGHFQVIWEAEDGVARQEVLAARSAIAAVSARLCCQAIGRERDGELRKKLMSSGEFGAPSDFIVEMADVIADPFLKLASRSLSTLSHLFRGRDASVLQGGRKDNLDILSNLNHAIMAADGKVAAFHAKCLVDFLEDREQGCGTKMSDPFMSEGSPLNRSRVGQLVRVIATEINTGAFGEDKVLGAEAVLAERYAAALGTVRQALAVLEDAGVVAVRRGRSNGWFACKPSMELPLRQIRNYLASCQMDPGHARRLIEMIGSELSGGVRNPILNILIQALEGYAAFSAPDQNGSWH